MKKVHKRIEKGNPNGCMFEEISRFPRKWESEFGLRGRERIDPNTPAGGASTAADLQATASAADLSGLDVLMFGGSDALRHRGLG